MHWINAVAILIMISSGWKIYNDDVIFGCPAIEVTNDGPRTIGASKARIGSPAFKMQQVAYKSATPKTLKGSDAVAAFRNSSKGQVVLVLQGGGALGAYQIGVYQALHEAGIELDWIIGTSIGAINAALIAGNTPERRIDALQEFGGACGATGSRTTCRLGPDYRT